jgi:hypothetical protein
MWVCFMASSSHLSMVKHACPQMLFVFATGYGNRPSVLDKLPNPQELDTGAGVRQYLVNQT